MIVCVIERTATMFAQAIVERGMLDGIAGGLARATYAIESRIGHGNAKWLVAALIVTFLFVMLRPRR
jgi:hypothetical protein